MIKLKSKFGEQVVLGNVSDRQYAGQSTALEAPIRGR